MAGESSITSPPTWGTRAISLRGFTVPSPVIVTGRSPVSTVMVRTIGTGGGDFCFFSCGFPAVMTPNRTAPAAMKAAVTVSWRNRLFFSLMSGRPLLSKEL